jgi:putative ABC transport system substrate-binding protein
VSYGVYWPDLNRRGGADITQILIGSNPGDIPFYQASRFEFGINFMKTAKELGLTRPQSLLAQAD